MERNGGCVSCTLASYAILFVLILNVFLLIGRFNGLGARYFVTVLPMVSIGVARWLEEVEARPSLSAGRDWIRIGLVLTAGLAAVLPWASPQGLSTVTLIWLTASLLGLAQTVEVRAHGLSTLLVVQLAVLSSWTLGPLDTNRTSTDRLSLLRTGSVNIACPRPGQFSTRTFLFSDEWLGGSAAPLPSQAFGHSCKMTYA